MRNRVETLRERTIVWKASQSMTTMSRRPMLATVACMAASSTGASHPSRLDQIDRAVGPLQLSKALPHRAALARGPRPISRLDRPSPRSQTNGVKLGPGVGGAPGVEVGNGAGVSVGVGGTGNGFPGGRLPPYGSCTFPWLQSMSSPESGSGSRLSGIPLLLVSLFSGSVSPRHGSQNPLLLQSSQPLHVAREWLGSPPQRVSLSVPVSR